MVSGQIDLNTGGARIKVHVGGRLKMNCWLMQSDPDEKANLPK
jgi:hypothetical protein